MDAVPDPTPTWDDERAPLLAGQLTEGWRWALAVGWALLVPAMMAIGDAAHSFGKATWWLDQHTAMATWRSPLPFLPLIAVAAAAAANWRHWTWVAAAGVATLGAGALADLGRTPGPALGEAVLAGGGLLVSVASLAGRVRSPRRSDALVPAGSEN